uniref:Uncharacterized protein n=1 Tax=Octopus bimaculoides TaxID=37653 RepID=A0A0L8HQ82_OCTBM
MSNLSCDGSWNSFKERICEIGSNTLGSVVIKQQDWFDDNDKEIGIILEEKINADLSMNRRAATNYGPTSSTAAPLHSKDSTEVLTNPKDIVRKWKEHFDLLLNRPTKVDLSLLDNIPERPTKHFLA